MNGSTLLATLGWSTSQGDAAVAGADAAEDGEAITSCPFPTSSTLAHPWRAGWIATSAELVAPPTMREAKAQGHLSVVIRGHGAAASLGVTIFRTSTGVGV